MLELSEILALAEKGGYCIPAFNVYNMETARAVLNAAEELRAPVIIQIFTRLVTTGAAEDLAPVIREMGKNAKVPVCFHLDHGAGEKEVIRSLRLGMTGIMYDASLYGLEENVARTKRVAELCGYVGVGVEGELGHVGKAANGDETALEYTCPEEAKRYVEETGVKALAVMVGTAHGRYKKAPVLDIERIKEIKRLTGIPLVLHGGSGVPDDQIKMAIEAGIRKMNFATDLCYAFLDSVRAGDKNIVSIDSYMVEPIKATEEFVKSKIRTVGAEGRV